LHPTFKIQEPLQVIGESLKSFKKYKEGLRTGRHSIEKFGSKDLNDDVRETSKFKRSGNALDLAFGVIKSSSKKSSLASSAKKKPMMTEA